MNILKELYVADGRAYKTKKTGMTVVNVEEPVKGLRLSFDTMFGQGDDVVIIHPNGFNIPISRPNMSRIINKINIEKGVISQQPRPKERGLYLDSISIPESVPATKL